MIFDFFGLKKHFKIKLGAKETQKINQNQKKIKKEKVEKKSKNITFRLLFLIIFGMKNMILSIFLVSKTLKNKARCQKNKKNQQGSKKQNQKKKSKIVP